MLVKDMPGLMRGGLLSQQKNRGIDRIGCIEISVSVSLAHSLIYTEVYIYMCMPAAWVWLKDRTG